jgi:prevent-host-death family protein
VQVLRQIGSPFVDSLDPIEPWVLEHAAWTTRKHLVGAAIVRSYDISGYARRPVLAVDHSVGIMGACVSRVIQCYSMTEVTVRELRNHGGEVLDRVARGERITITRDGRRVAELRPLIASKLSAEALLIRWRHLPAIDPVTFRNEIDGVLDSTLQ